jgi:hypothetical protein
MPRPGDGPERRLADELVDAHTRSLLVDHVTDVVSSDQHTVKPWFNGKVPFGVPAADLTAAGFPLAGGRLDYVAGREVAALVYRRRSHVINAFLWPEAGEAPPREQTARGYTVLHFAHAGLTWWLVSDASPADLRELGGLLAGGTTADPVSEKQEQPDLTVRFHCLPPPTDDDVEQLDARIVRRTARVLGCRDAALVADPELDPLAHAVAEAVQPPTLTEPATDPRRARRRCAFLDGFSLHADTAVAPADSAARERLARYLLRPRHCRRPRRGAPRRPCRVPLPTS